MVVIYIRLTGRRLTNIKAIISQLEHERGSCSVWCPRSSSGSPVWHSDIPWFKLLVPEDGSSVWVPINHLVETDWVPAARHKACRASVSWYERYCFLFPHPTFQINVFLKEYENLVFGTEYSSASWYKAKFHSYEINLVSKLANNFESEFKHFPFALIAFYQLYCFTMGLS